MLTVAHAGFLDFTWEIAKIRGPSMDPKLYMAVVTATPTKKEPQIIEAAIPKAFYMLTYHNIQYYIPLYSNDRPPPPTQTLKKPLEDPHVYIHIYGL